MSRLLVLLACLILAVTSLFPASEPKATEQAVETASSAANDLPDSLVCGYAQSSSPNPLR